MADLKQNIQYVKGVGPTKAELLNYLGIYTLEDIITYYPRKYEETTEIVDLLIVNDSILIDFQYMTEVQARRCLDYLDGARYVLAGNLRRVASTMYLLTPINVVVNIEDIRLPNDVEVAEYDFDMKRNR